MSGDTAFRSARMIIADYLNIAQKKLSSRLWLAVIPAAFITMATFTYILNATIGFNLPMNIAYVGAVIISAVIVAAFFIAGSRGLKKNIQLDDDISNFNNVA